MISDYHVSARPLDRGKNLQDHRLFVYPSLASSCLHHRELTAHIVRRGRHVILFLGPVNQVQVGKGRFHHDHVCTLCHIETDLSKGLLRVGIVHLIRSPVSELRGRKRRFSKWSEERGCVLGRICQNGHVVVPSVV